MAVDELIDSPAGRVVHVHPDYQTREVIEVRARRKNSDETVANQVAMCCPQLQG